METKQQGYNGEELMNYANDNPLFTKANSVSAGALALNVAETTEGSEIRKADSAAIYAILSNYDQKPDATIDISYKMREPDELSEAFDTLNNYFDVCQDVMFGQPEVYGTDVFDAYKTRIDEIDEAIKPFKAYMSTAGLSVFFMLSQHNAWKAAFPKPEEQEANDAPSGYIDLEDSLRIQKDWRKAYLGTAEITLSFPNFANVIKNDPDVIKCLEEVAAWCAGKLQYKQYELPLLNDAAFLATLPESV
jgi:hypothetical protein